MFDPDWKGFVEELIYDLRETAVTLWLQDWQDTSVQRDVDEGCKTIGRAMSYLLDEIESTEELVIDAVRQRRSNVEGESR